MEKIFVRSAYNYDMNEASRKSGLHCKDKTRTQQHFKEECDINTIVQRFGLTGELPTTVQTPTYGDYTGIFDFQSAMNKVVEAQQNFMTLPAKIRARFHNDPQELLEFVTDESNRPEAEKLGLVERAPQPTEASPTPSGAPPAAAAAQPGAAAPDPK